MYSGHRNVKTRGYPCSLLEEKTADSTVLRAPQKKWEKGGEEEGRVGNKAVDIRSGLSLACVAT